MSVEWFRSQGIGPMREDEGWYYPMAFTSGVSVFHYVREHLSLCGRGGYVMPPFYSDCSDEVKCRTCKARLRDAKK